MVCSLFCWVFLKKNMYETKIEVIGENRLSGWLYCEEIDVDV